MTTENSVTGTSLRRWTAGALIGAAAVAGLGLAPVASAEPDASSQEQPAQRVSPDQVLMMISDQYQTGSGGGQVSKLIEQVMTLRQRGIRPSAANAQALLDGLNSRPNQKPLIDALQSTLSYQRRMMNQQASGGSAAPAPGSGGSAPSWAPVAGDDGNNALIPPGWGGDMSPW
ncbi:hypothetical protein ASE48_30995 [Mycobacterium sp. Root265]|uniref:hypothetical protein n=1 Tax=Mycobacterium sp. Root265 TaxID=1736504 RepID=UPI00070D61C4|nr:hypothetical protein [Mycobacterium sp. Root265]KRD13097.1 hypothetical protein ASE48_30995 [Mycobacterium sp. Root265]